MITSVKLSLAIIIVLIHTVSAFILLDLPRNHRFGSGSHLPAQRKNGGSQRRGGPPTTKPKLAGRGSKKTTRKDQSTSQSKHNPTEKPQKKTSQRNSKGSSAPPWQVLSRNDAKRNVETEIVRRQRAREGDHSFDNSNNIDSNQRTLSTAFLSETDQRFLKWKRFNPLSAPMGMKFVGSYLDKRLPPSLGVPEVAFLGRSNVGKSSLLNRLSVTAGQRDQARVGKTPGATASVNLYALVDSKGKELLGWTDLPGFGYARLSKDIKESVQAAAENYLGRRRQLCLGILLVDIRREPSPDDRAVLAALYDLGVPLIVVATKIDKVSSSQLDGCLATIRDGLGLPDGQPLAVSSTRGDGTRELWKIILEACEEGVQAKKLKYDEETRKQKEVEEQESGDAFDDDDDDIVYSQGYDWVHSDRDYLYEDEVEDRNEFEEGDPWEAYEDDFDDDLKPQRETFQQLRQRARDLEKRGEI